MLFLKGIHPEQRQNPRQRIHRSGHIRRTRTASERLASSRVVGGGRVTYRCGFGGPGGSGLGSYRFGGCGRPSGRGGMERHRCGDADPGRSGHGGRASADRHTWRIPLRSSEIRTSRGGASLRRRIRRTTATRSRGRGLRTGRRATRRRGTVGRGRVCMGYGGCTGHQDPSPGDRRPSPHTTQHRRCRLDPPSQTRHKLPGAIVGHRIGHRRPCSQRSSSSVRAKRVAGLR